MFVEPHALQLEADLEKRFPTLVPTLARTRSQVEAFWKHSNRLEHFTDHSHQHSRRVSSLANTLANARKNAGKVIRLNLLERYVLEQAAWVHDIGMQHIGAPDSRGPVTIDPDEVRKAHPRVSRDAVLGPLANGFQLDHGIPDEFSTLIDAIAWLAYSHGTHTYKEGVRELRQITSFLNFPIRGERLAALLLLADELDLCMERVPKAAAAYQLSTLSSAHWLKHEVVEDIAITERSKPDEGKVVGFTVKIRTYRNLPKADARAVGEWIRDKLISQIALTESEMIASYDGQYRFDRRVDISLRDSPTMDCRSARPEVLALIRADNAKADLINHEECTATCRSHLESGTSVVVVGKMSEQDKDSREDVFELLCAYERVAGSDVRVITRHQSKPHTSASDLLAPWLQNPNLEQKTVKQHETVRRDLFLAALQNELLRSAGPTTLALSSIGALSKEVRSWFLAEAIPKLNALPGVRLLITADARIPAAHLEGLWAQQAVRKTAVRDLHAYLAKHWASGETVPPGITYSHARWYRLNLYAEAASA